MILSPAASPMAARMLASEYAPRAETDVAALDYGSSAVVLEAETIPDLDRDVTGS